MVKINIDQFLKYILELEAYGLFDILPHQFRFLIFQQCHPVSSHNPTIVSHDFHALN